MKFFWKICFFFQIIGLIYCLEEGSCEEQIFPKSYDTCSYYANCCFVDIAAVEPFPKAITTCYNKVIDAKTMGEMMKKEVEQAKVSYSDITVQCNGTDIYHYHNPNAKNNTCITSSLPGEYSQCSALSNMCCYIDVTLSMGSFLPQKDISLCLHKGAEGVTAEMLLDMGKNIGKQYLEDTTYDYKKFTIQCGESDVATYNNDATCSMSIYPLNMQQCTGQSSSKVCCYVKAKINGQPDYPFCASKISTDKKAKDVIDIAKKYLAKMEASYSEFTVECSETDKATYKNSSSGLKINFFIIVVLIVGAIMF